MTNTKSLHTLASETAHRLGMTPGADMGPIVDALDEAYAMGEAHCHEPVKCLHFSDVLTDDVLDSIGAQAAEQGDLVMAARCEHAKVDGLALRDVAICLDEQWAEPMSPEDRESLSPGIKWLVLGLQAAGFHTSDSGDGSNYKDGMECALPFRHVAIQCAYWQDPEAEAERVQRYLAWIGADDEFEAYLSEVEGASTSNLIVVVDKAFKEIVAGSEGEAAP